MGMCGCSEEEVLEKRFMEYIVSGMCCACQIYYIERQRGEEAGGDSLPSLGDTFVEFREANLRPLSRPGEYSVIRSVYKKVEGGEQTKIETETAKHSLRLKGSSR